MFKREYAEHVGYEADTVTRVADLEAKEARKYVRFWELLFRLYKGGKRAAKTASEVERKDFFSRPLLCTPFKGHYGFAGWVCAVNGSPPRGMVIFQLGHRDIVYYASGRPRELQPFSPDWDRLWDFHARYLEEADGPLVKYPPDVRRYEELMEVA